MSANHATTVPRTVAVGERATLSPSATESSIAPIPDRQHTLCAAAVVQLHAASRDHVPALQLNTELPRPRGSSKLGTSRAACADPSAGVHQGPATTDCARPQHARATKRTLSPCACPAAGTLPPSSCAIPPAAASAAELRGRAFLPGVGADAYVRGCARRRTLPGTWSRCDTLLPEPSAAESLQLLRLRTGNPG